MEPGCSDADASLRSNQPIVEPAYSQYRVRIIGIPAALGLGTLRGRFVEKVSLDNQPIGSRNMVACMK
jgi:hypothetical protein